MSQPTGFIWVGPVTDIGGYGNVSRNYLKSLEKLGLPIFLYNTSELDPNIGEINSCFIDKLSSTNVGVNPYLFIHSTPDLFARFN
ncbi:hypothetical protein PSH55_22450, partial [Pseudoalteromonas sp. Angola-31]|nr:hypothetical protein [Pseudoalteromonas sp. Angola-31]